MDVGESWAYRARWVDPLAEVRVVKVGSSRPARVLVRFVADEFEGREEWVPPARLKVPWSGVDVFVAKESRWDAVSASPVRDTAEYYATSLVFDELIDRKLATVGYNATAGVTTIHDVDGLARFLDVGIEELRADPLAFVEEGALVVPWPITALIARRAAERNPDPVLRHVDKDEDEQRKKMMYGESYRETRRSEARYLEPGFFVDIDEQPYHRPCRELLRQWCGVEAVERRDELKELRKEVARLGRLLQDAVMALRHAGVNKDAAQIERDLGVTVEDLRRR